MADKTACWKCGREVSGRQAMISICSRCEKEALAAGQVCESCKRKLDSYPCAYCGKTAPDRVTPFGVAFLLGLVVLGGGGFVWVVSALVGGAGSPPPSPTHSEAGAILACQNFVERRLRAPSSAEWPRMAGDAVETDHLGQGRYEVHTHVDAQNAFGAMIRNEVKCTVEFEPVDRTWRSMEVSVQPR